MYKSYPIVALICIPLMTNDAEHLFNVYICHPYVLFGEAFKTFAQFFRWSIQDFCPLLMGYFLSVEFLEVFMYSGSKFLLRYIIWKCVFPMCVLALIILIVSFADQRFLIWRKSTYQFFCFINQAFGITSENSLCNHRTWRFFSYFSF